MSAKTHAPVPLEIRILRAVMEMKGLLLTDVARKAKVHISRASEILKGRRNDRDKLAQLRTAICGPGGVPREVKAVLEKCFGNMR